MLTYRAPRPRDERDVRGIHATCFPIIYTDAFFQTAVAADSPYYARVAGAPCIRAAWRPAENWLMPRLKRD